MKTENVTVTPRGEKGVFSLRELADLIYEVTGYTLVYSNFETPAKFTCIYPSNDMKFKVPNDFNLYLIKVPLDSEKNL